MTGFNYTARPESASENELEAEPHPLTRQINADV